MTTTADFFDKLVRDLNERIEIAYIEDVDGNIVVDYASLDETAAPRLRHLCFDKRVQRNTSSYHEELLRVTIVAEPKDMMKRKLLESETQIYVYWRNPEEKTERDGGFQYGYSLSESLKSPLDQWPEPADFDTAWSDLGKHVKAALKEFPLKRPED